MHREPMSYRSHRPGAAHSPGASSGWEVISSRGRDLPFPSLRSPCLGSAGSRSQLCCVRWGRCCARVHELWTDLPLPGSVICLGGCRLAPPTSPASLQPRGPAQRWPWRQGPSGACRVSENRGGWSESPTRLRCVAGVLLELGLEKEHVTKQRAERYVLKLDAEAQARFKSFLQNSSRNPHTLFVLIHDHAHWDLARLVWLRHTAGLARTFFGITDVGESWDGGHSLKPSATGGAASSADATAVLQTLGAGSDPRGPPGAASESYRSRN